MLRTPSGSPYKTTPKIRDFSGTPEGEREEDPPRPSLQDHPNNQASIQCYRDIVVQTQEEFPKGICATLKGDTARNFDLAEGTKVRVFFEPRAYRSKASGKWFTSCHAWRIDAC